MKTAGQGQKRAPGKMAYLMTSLACFFSIASVAGAVTGSFEGWRLEQDVAPPSYAVIDPASTNLNVDSIVLACEEAGQRQILQLQLYLSTEGPLSPLGSAPQSLKDNPRAEITIDDRVFPVGIFFADDYVVLADEKKEMFPLLSDRLLVAMQVGRNMVLRFDLVAEHDDRAAKFDGEVVIDLQAGKGGAAVATVRRCADEGSHRPGITVSAGS